MHGSTRMGGVDMKEASSDSRSFKGLIRGIIQRLWKNSEGVQKSGAEWRCFDKTRRYLAADKLSFRGKIVVGTGMLLHPNAVKRAISYSRSSKKGGSGLRYAIVSFSDMHGNLGQQMQWGDYWVKQELTAAITGLGGIVVEPFMRPDVMIHLFGGFYDLPPAGEHVLWIHSHPEKLDPKFLNSYDRVYCISRNECDSFRDKGVQCTWLPMATGKRLQSPGTISERVVFVGNAIPELGGHRPVVDDMLSVLKQNQEIKFSLWGGLYKDLPPGVLVAEYIPNHELDALYAGSAIVLNDHRREMRERGYINPRILDVVASGGFVVSDRNAAVEDYLGDSVPQYDGADELGDILSEYIGHPDRRSERMVNARERVLEYTWTRVAKGLMGVER